MRFDQSPGEPARETDDAQHPQHEEEDRDVEKRRPHGVREVGPLRRAPELIAHRGDEQRQRRRRRQGEDEGTERQGEAVAPGPPDRRRRGRRGASARR